LGTAASIAPQIEGLRRGLNESGYVDGRNLTIEFRWPEGQFDRLPSLALELIRLRPAVIFAHGVCGNSARTDLGGGRSVMAVPTALRSELYRF
jgi:hypothetical protein